MGRTNRVVALGAAVVVGGDRRDRRTVYFAGRRHARCVSPVTRHSAHHTRPDSLRAGDRGRHRSAPRERERYRAGRQKPTGSASRHVRVVQRNTFPVPNPQ